VQRVPDRSGGEYRLPGRPWHFSGEELTPIGRPAFQGEHNFEVFGELGVDKAELTRLAEQGVLVTHPRARPEAAAKPATTPEQAA
jgi:crotonobetainyl-CoA:carnitine CoA-transferase CaiB-like acyl-CoA transferase